MADAKKAEEVYTAVVKRLLANGTTTASYYATLHANSTEILAEIAKVHKQRAFIGRVCMIQNSPDYYRDPSEEASKAADQEVIDYCAKLDPEREYICPIMTPRFAPSCTMEAMKHLGVMCKEHRLPCQTHISENQAEIEWVQSLFPESKSYADVYDTAGLLHDRTILAHAIHLSDEEIALIKERKSGISHCPISNSSISSGLCPVRTLLDNGIHVGLGTDVSGGYASSILDVARHALLVSRLLSFLKKDEKFNLSKNEVLHLATLGGAKVCGLDSKLGNFQVGKKWDAQLIDLKAPQSPIDVLDWYLPEDDEERLEYLVQKWLFNGDDRNTAKVWVNGIQVVSKEEL